MGSTLPFVSLLLLIPWSLATVTVYHQAPLGSATISTSTTPATYTAAAAYDPNMLTPPAVPQAFATQISVSVPVNTDSIILGPPLKGSFLGFSIEFSVINQVFGKNSSSIQVPFLNLMSNLQQRGGEIRLRVGGNTQETATLVDFLPNGEMISKQPSNISDPTSTPTLFYTADAIYMLGNISSFVDIKWFLGLPFNDTTDLRLQIAEIGEAVLDPGGYLLGLQVGNEPDLYAAHGLRDPTYGPSDYFDELGIVINAINADSYISVKNNLVVPSVSGTWSLQEVFDTGLISSYGSSLGYIAIEHYPTHNCYTQYGIGSPVIPQDVFSNFLNHTSALALVAPYLNASAYAASVEKPLVMLETNTASCGGLPGLSDTFGAALWAVDFALQMGAIGFWGAMLHVGGQDAYYNPFTPPPTNQSSYHQWTVGPVFYSSIFVAEALGPTGDAQLVDLTSFITSPSVTSDTAPPTSIYTPVYAIYEHGVPMRLVAFNFVTDTSGSSTVQFQFRLAGGEVSSSVQVKYLQAPSVSEKNNITWANQTFGSTFESDGRLQGTSSISTIECSAETEICTVPLPAPCAALLFLTPSAFSESNPSAIPTFATTSTKTHNTATINPSVLATSNGISGLQRNQLASTSRENGSVAERRAKMGKLATIAISALSSLIGVCVHIPWV